MKDRITNTIKYIYISTNIILAAYILLNTSFLQTTLYKYVAEQNGLTKSGHAAALISRSIVVNLQSAHAEGIREQGESRPFDAAKIYFLLAMVSAFNLFSPKTGRAKRSLKETFKYFKRFIPFFHRLFCISAISLRAPPLSV